MAYSVPHYINGEAVLVKSNERKMLYNPALGTPAGEVFFANQAQCEQAITAAKNAFPAWADTPPVKRARLLFTFRALLEKHQSELASIVTQEHGKTLDDAKGSVARAIEVVEFHCSLITQLQGTYSANVANQIDTFTLKEPLGVCAGISPFNFPVMVPVWMMIPAIACGNTFILKPSEQAPSAPVRLLELLSDAGLPDGVVNCVHGDKNTVDYLLHHQEIQAFTAVASTPVAEYIYKTATASGKRAHTFGGAKNHCVVMPDANFDFTAKAITGAAFGSAGERCMALSVVVTVGEQTPSMLLDKLIPLIQAMRVDAGNEENVDMGPVISAEHRKRLIAAIDKGVEEGGNLIIDGRPFTHPAHFDGFFIGPTLFDKVTETMSIYQNELFGPVLVLVRVEQFEQALDLINRNQYGNGTAIFTQDGHTARQYVQQVQAGLVGINIPIPVPIASHPFGGWKRSAFGDTGMHGQDSIHFYTKNKTITARWPRKPEDERAFIMPSH